MHRSTVFTFVTISVLVATLAAGSDEQTSSRREVLDAVPAEFKPVFEGGWVGLDEQQVWAGFPYDRIELERTACFGVCPVYRVTLLRGGRAELDAKSGYPHIGRFVGAIHLDSYGRLCYLMQQLGFEKLSPLYTVMSEDLPTVNVTAVVGTRTVRISEYGRTGPIELWGIQQAIDSVASQTEWRRRP
jgi:hypothetical protein